MTAATPAADALANLATVRERLDRALRNSNRALARDRALDRNRDRDLRDVFTDVLNIAFDLTGAFARTRTPPLDDVDIAYATARDLAVHLDVDVDVLVLAHACGRALDSAYSVEHIRDINLGGGFIELVGHARACAMELEKRWAADSESGGRSGEGMGVVVAGAAARVATWAVRILPVADRARYGEEFRGELWELAAAGGGRRQQFRHAVVLLFHGPRLRGELKACHARRAVS